MAVSFLLVPQGSIAQGIDCNRFPMECQDSVDTNSDPGQLLLDFAIELKESQMKPSSVSPKASPKTKSKPIKSAVSKLVGKSNSKIKAVLHKRLPPKLKPKSHASKTVKNSWDGLPVIAPVFLKQKDLADISNQYMAVFDLAALAIAGVNLQTVTNDQLAQQLGIAPNQIRSVQRRFLGSIVFSATPQQAQTVAANTFVLFVEPDSQIKAAAEKKKKTLPLSWGLDRLDSPLLPLDGKFNRDEGKYEARVYLFDTRVANEKTEFENRIVARQSFLHFDEKDEIDCRSHGTEMASLIAGGTTGAAPRAVIVSLVVLPCNTEKTGQASSLVDAAEWLLVREADHGDGKPAIANMSLSGRFSRTLNHVVKVLTNKSVTVVAAAGNESDNACRYSPGSAPEAITVAATAPDDSIWDRSNKGACIDAYAPGSLLTVLSLGQGKNSKPSYAAIDGTSGATALVTGLLARAISKQGQVEAHQWLREAGVPGKLWRKDNQDITLVQSSSNWKNNCRASVKLQLWQEPLAIDRGPVVQEGALVTITDRRGKWWLVSTDAKETGWFIPRGEELSRLNGSICD